MSGLFVPLDVEYDSDDKIILAGAMAELLYIRSLAFCKRTMKNGIVMKSQLIVIARGIKGAESVAAKLVLVGLWRDEGDKWTIPAWSKRNKLAEDIVADKEAKKAASIRGNHERWHVGDDAKKSASCPLCYPKPDPKPDPTKIPRGIPKPKVEPEEEPQPEVEEEPTLSTQDRYVGGGDLARILTGQFGTVDEAAS
jgi:hypothetical protein